MVIFIAALAWFWVKEKGQKYLDPKVEDSLWHKVSEFKQNHIRRSNDRFLEHIPFVEDIVPSDSVRPTKMAMHRKDLLRDEQQRFAVDGSNMKDELFKNAILQRYSTVRNLELNKDGDGDAKSNGQQDTSLLDNDDVEIVYAGDEDPKSKGQQDPAFKRNNDVEILYTEWTSYNVRIASVDDVSDVMALLLENQDVMKLRSENEVRILIAQKFAVVCTTTNALGEEVIIGYFEDRVLREEQMGESEINKVLLKQTGRTINCREKDLIFYWGGLVGKKNSRGISRAISRFVAEKHSSQVQEAHLKRQRVLFIWCAMKVVHRRSTKIANSFVSGVAGEDAVTHKVSFPTTMRDGSGRNGQMVIVHMDPQLLPLQQKRLSRNVCLITEAEQRRLMNCRIGVIGLSTGSVALEVLLREGIGGQYRIADFDVFEISNSNRMLYGVADEGASKIDLCAQRIASVDPAIQIEKYPKGLNQENVEQFVRGCDLIVEECDNIMVKAMVRVNAQKFKIPLVMGTSQNGMIDVERYDVDSECRPFYLESLPPGLAEGHSLSAEEKTKFLARLFSKDQLSPRFVEAMPQVGVTIPSWPQLAEQVTLNAATVAHSARRILLGDHGLVSGRFAIRMDRLFVPENRLYPSVRD